MKKIATFSLAALALAGCGSTGAAGVGSAGTNAATTAAPSTQGYFNMDTLAADYKTEVQKKAAKDSSLSGVSVTNVSCIATGKQTATCHIAFSDGNETSNTVDISTDGSQFISH